MSPRSVEFMDQARDRAATAREILASGHLEAAVSAAYYAMLYAARAALSVMSVAKYLERIADHASNIAADVIFWVRGADVRHQLSLAVD